MKAKASILLRLAGLMMLLLTACTPSRTAPSSLVPVNVAPTSTPAQNLEALKPFTSPSEGEEHHLLTRYYLDAHLDYELKTLAVAQTIIYTNNTGTALTELPLMIPPAHHPKVFSLESLQTNPAHTQVTYDGARIDVQLDLPLAPGQQLEISLDYQLRLSQGWGTPGYTDRQVLLADWYPMIPPYREGTGWLIHSPGEVGEFLVYPLNHFYLNLCLKPSQPELIVAASAPLFEMQDTCYRYQVENRRNFSLAVSPFYRVASATSDLVTVRAYSFPEHAHLAQRAAERAVEAWTTFTDLLGENPRDYLSIVEAEIFDGLETDGLIYLSDWYYQTADPTPQNYFELLVVHETVHQWFYGMVHNDQALEPWLDEALATYSELLYYEIHHPTLIDWWWDDRVSAYEPEGMVNTTIYNHRQYRPYINAVYLRGALFLQALRDEIGEEAFFTGLKTYAQPGDEDIRASADFFDVFFARPENVLLGIKSEYFH